ncbi:MAG: hypothetical protein AAF264_06670 [Pseudomonadota bacterium]
MAHDADQSADPLGRIGAGTAACGLDSVPEIRWAVVTQAPVNDLIGRTLMDTAPARLYLDPFQAVAMPAEDLLVARDSPSDPAESPRTPR